jgi:hypothetical protein
MKKSIIMDPGPPWDEKLPERRKSRFNKWKRRILMIWAIRNKRWDIVILIMLIDEGKKKAVKLDRKLKKESGWQEFLLGRTF